MRTALTFFVILIAYGLLVAATCLYMPLRLGEILQAAASLNFSWDKFFAWIASTPSSAPLNYLVQLPFALSGGSSRLLLRIPSIAFAIGSLFLFFVLAKRTPLQHPLLALVLFLAVPVHFAYATQARPFEQGLFLMLLATLSFLSLMERPTMWRALLYGVLLTACLYTQASSYLPAVGHLIYLLGFANLPSYRRALWFALPFTILPLAAYFRYFAWAGGQRKEWLVEQFPSYAYQLAPLQAALSIDPSKWNPWFGLVLCGLLVLGLIAGIWSCMPLGAYPDGSNPAPVPVVRKRAVVFCLAGGAIVTALGEIALAAWTDSPFAPFQILWALPGLIIVTCAALDAMVKSPLMKSLALASPVLTWVLILLCIPGNLEYLKNPPEDIAKLTALVRPEITGDACLVFVSQKLSRYVFEVYEPDLGEFECQNFFHKKIVLAIHPFVRPDQERDARVFFRGLDFEETKRQHAAGGEVITMDAQK